jgi:ketosteroid isomerase-like protein
MESSSTEALISKFYTAFANLDAEAMASCYHKEVVFEDPAFGILKGEKAGNMWRMLCQSQKGKDFVVTYSGVEAADGKGSARWQAKYTFSQTGRKVHNKIHAHFEFVDGKIIKHTDAFDLKQWAKQAMGFKGALLGGTSFFKNKLQQQTNGMLAKFESKL